MGSYKDSFTDYQKENIFVDWNQETWTAQFKKHPILIDHKRTTELISESLLNPSVVFQTFKTCSQQTRIYYQQKEVIGNFQVYFIKITVGFFENKWCVKTVYDEYSAIGLQLKERKYKKVFKEIWNNQKNRL